MTHNIGGADRILRIVLGLAMIGFAISGRIGNWGWLGVVLLLTASVGTCPLYSALGYKPRTSTEP